MKIRRANLETVSVEQMPEALCGVEKVDFSRERSLDDSTCWIESAEFHNLIGC